ncbi:pyruvate dehydrogenase (acetyl-transferring) E1 component subunit alpha [Pseudonocardiaceae bacterium YIM PH 21723]|nr:pyruvate dehydrogenase (acetyl-transferring) E1 component subunit alpha [Pseudonocardiaceae bacterium YIM PH 21723]
MKKVRPMVLHAPETGHSTLLPSAEPVQLIDEHGAVTPHADYDLPSEAELLAAYRALVLGRRFDRQATTMVKQGRLAVYPSSNGQEASQVGAVLATRNDDWLFPTYRDCVALVTRGVDPVGVLTLLRGDWHSGYDPYEQHVAPQCTPLATQSLHGVGLAHAARLKGEDTVALVFIGDGATSEGDFHEALNFAAVFKAPVVFFVQNNGFAISVPLDKQSVAPSLAHKAIGYGIPGKRVDGNDVAAVISVVSAAVERARAGEGPTLIEAHTYRIDAHTNADDATRYRDAHDVEAWRGKDPVSRIDAYLRGTGALTEELAAGYAAEAEAVAEDLRRRLGADPVTDPRELFHHVYADRERLADQARLLDEELALEEGAGQ